MCILLAQVAATIGIGGTVWLRDQTRTSMMESTVDLGPPAFFMLEAAQVNLRHGGVGALRDLAADSRRTRLYVLDEQGKELLGRNAPPRLLQEVDRSLHGGGQGHPVARLIAPDGRRYLAFVAHSERMSGSMGALEALRHTARDPFLNDLRAHEMSLDGPGSGTGRV